MKLIAMYPLLAALSLAPAQSGRDLGSMVASERAFARHASEHSVKDAFLTFLSEEAIVFDDGPVNAHKAWRGRPESKGKLVWEPEVAEIAASGDLGFTSGPWRALKPDGTTAGHGNFFTIWKWREPGEWKAELDLGNVDPGELIERKPVATAHTRGPVKGATSEARNKAASKLRGIDGALGQTTTLADAYAKAASPRIRYLPPAGRRLEGRETVAAFVGKTFASQETKPSTVVLSAGADFGYCMGTLKRKMSGSGKEESGHYVRVWRLESGVWRLLFEVTNVRA